MSTLEQMECNGYQAALPELVSRIEALEQRIEDLALAFEMHVNAEHEQRLDDLAASVKRECLVDRIRGAAKLLIDCDPRGLFDALAGDDLHELAERVHAALSVRQLESGED